ncbi:MAG: hypothetical protein HFI78_14215 [Lachnospiraceae bacterium]|jgi:hypothetical protein|uniref:hypothetical protein n=1 Tax=Parablautia intestinalis TaxID=2320100 RepID=UPI00259C9EAF|nr:hypothetical protein [Parablautia intestinalis]MCI9140784.1 hypothetical protein [Lachnospiraceae bacterium]
MILLSQMIKEVAKESLSHENMESAAKKLRRKFEKLIRVCGGDIEKMKDGKKCISFPDEEKEFIIIILTQLAREEGLSQKLWEERDDSMILEEVHDFIQYFINYLEKKGYSEGVIKDVVKTMDILFQLTVRQKLDYCHKLLDCYAENLAPYLYTYQVHFMDRLIKELSLKTVESTVEASIYCSDLANVLKAEVELRETDDVSKFYGMDNDPIRDEYVERDKQVIAYLKQHPEIKKAVEEKMGAKISLIWKNIDDENER